MKVENKTWKIDVSFFYSLVFPLSVWAKKNKKLLALFSSSTMGRSKVMES